MKFWFRPLKTQKICLIFRISTPFLTDNNCESGVLKLDNKNRFDQNKNDQNRNEQNRNDQNKNNQNKKDQNKNDQNKNNR